MNQNPLQTAIQMMNMGRNPMGMLQQMAGNNPQLAQAMQIINRKSPQQLQQMAQNMAKERGINLDEFARSLGIAIPSNR